MHEQGPFTIIDNCINYINKQDTNHSKIVNPAMIVDTETSTMLKIGELNELKPYFDTLVFAYSQFNMETDCIKLITFNDKSNDDICTILNVAYNIANNPLITNICCVYNQQHTLSEIKKYQELGY